ncbi:hypothetical protein PH562_01815 [Rhizobium sp. CNPSo 4062]|uniref:hypothetical protein n=1 Tax=Rhizobium sp. CNPSo 4062 TaxID=3021410 RepID=UPI000DDF55E4|nr:hypothetical protein [Rhizobium sp. CNPSo 4062]MDK4700956.1 hypothetical protein [Rhizobium sp. CNPSo 4062]
MEKQRRFERRRPVRGAAYTLTDFQKKYALDDRIAEDLFIRFGPSSIELDLLMAAKRHTPTLNELTEDMPQQ